MSVTKPWKTQQSLTKKLFSYVVYAILPLIMFLCFLSPFSITQTSTDDDQFSRTSFSISSSPSSSFLVQDETDFEVQPSSALPPKEEYNEVKFQPSSRLPSEENRNASEFAQESPTEIPSNASELAQELPKEISPNASEFVQELSHEIPSTCDYTNGEWIKDETGPLYNGSSCGTIKEGQNCMSHGRPDKDYLHWKWKPKQCDVPRFDPSSLLRILQGKHLAFVGDSLARNQLESLLCMISSISPPNLVYTSGVENKFRRWHISSHNVIISVYWSPFLVKGIEKAHDKDHNRLYLDVVDERWASDLDSIDMVVLSIGQWFLLRAAYYDGNSLLGCHSVEGINCTEIEFYDVFGKAINTTLKAVLQRKGAKGNGVDVVVTTFSPHHFEGDWDKFGACSKINPYKEGEITLDGMNDNMRKIAVQEVEKAKAELNNIGDQNTVANVRVAALDVTKLSLLRPDGHPGPYMYPFPFENGVKDRVHNDCVHWCLPGPIDTWNEIMLDIIKRWHISN